MPFDNTPVTTTEFDEDTAVLVRAKNLLIEKGWCIGIQQDANGRHCAIGAITHSGIGFLSTTIHNSDSPREQQILRLWRRLAAVIEKEYPEFGPNFLPSYYRIARDGHAVANFNNAQSSVGPVLELFDKAIAQVPV